MPMHEHRLRAGWRLTFSPALKLDIFQISQDAVTVIIHLLPGAEISFSDSRISPVNLPGTYTYRLPFGLRVNLAQSHWLQLSRVVNDHAYFLESYSPDLSPARSDPVPF